MAEEAKTENVQGVTPEVTPEAKVEESKTFTQDQVNEIVSQRLAKFKLEAIDKAAEVKAAEALSKVTAIQQKLEATEYEAQLLKLSQTGANVDLLRKTGLRGEALDGFAADLVASTPAAPEVTKKNNSAEATIAAFINRNVKESNGSAGDWKASVLQQMGGLKKHGA